MTAARRQYHASSAGLIYLLVSVFLGIGAVNSQNNLLFLAFGLALGALLVSGLVSGIMLLNLEVEREAPMPTTVGDAMLLRYRVVNRSRRIPAFALRISEARPKRGWKRRRDADDWARYFDAPETFILHLGRGRSAFVDAMTPAMARGEARLNQIRIDTRFPFGIIRKSVVFEQAARVLVRPEPIVVEGMRQLTASAFDMRNSGERPVSGRGLEYLGVREYAPGDARRMIAWRASARRGDLIVREHMTPTPERTTICLDLTQKEELHEEASLLRRSHNAHRSEDAGERAISMAAWMIQQAVRHGHDIAVEVPAAEIRTGFGTAGQPGAPVSTRWTGALLDTLARIDRTSLSGGGANARGLQKSASLIVIHDGDWSASDWPTGAIHLSAARMDALPEDQSVTSDEQVAHEGAAA